MKSASRSSGTGRQSRRSGDGGARKNSDIKVEDPLSCEVSSDAKAVHEYRYVYTLCRISLLVSIFVSRSCFSQMYLSKRCSRYYRERLHLLTSIQDYGVADCDRLQMIKIVIPDYIFHKGNGRGPSRG